MNQTTTRLTLNDIKRRTQEDALIPKITPKQFWESIDRVQQHVVVTEQELMEQLDG